MFAIQEEKTSPRRLHLGSRLLYWLIIKPVSRLPYFLLYGVSDFFYIVLRYVFPYRKKVIMANLDRVFPEKSQREREMMCRRFYHHFSDLVVESLKNFSVSRQSLEKRLKQINPELLNKYADAGQSLILCGGHYGNWELWGVAAPLHLKHQLLAIYKRIRNPFFDDKMRKTRSRFGLYMVATKNTSAYMKEHEEELNALIFGFDQSPANPEKCLWIDFLGQDTAAYFGAEKYAVEYNRPVIYGHLKKVRRGYYEVRYKMVTEDPRGLEKGVITRKLFELLEEDIREAPEFWLWSHRRWKHQRGRL